jgi:ribose transport system substrate-binding protein
MRGKTRFAVLSGLALIVVMAVAANATLAARSTKPSASRSSAKTLNIVYLASATANGFSNAVWTGMQQEAKKLGGIKLNILDGNFNATTQYNQLQDAASSHQYSGAVTLLNDTVGSVPAVKVLMKSGTVVSNVLNPLGNHLDSLAPQVPGLLNVIAAPSYDTTLQATRVVSYCKSKNPCNVVILIGSLQFPFDKVRYNAYLKVLNAHSNIHILATGEGFYDRAKALTAMNDIIQAHPKFDVLLSATDQETEGAAIAMKQAGWNTRSMVANGTLFIDSLGGDQQGVAAVRSGDWNLTVGNFPRTAGKLALKQVVDKLRGKKVTPFINLDKAAPVPLVLLPEVLKKYPNFTGEWSG